MEPKQKFAVMIVMTAALFGFAARAHANLPSPDTPQAAAAILAIAKLVQADRRGIAQTQISDAARHLEQACLQRDFASNARELALLQRAHEDLAAAATQLQGVQHARTIDVLADLDHAIRRASTHLGPLVSPDGDMYGPLPPSRDELAQLAKEAQDLERNAPTIHRLRDSVNLGSTTRDRTGARPKTGSAAVALAGNDPLSWPLGAQAAWPQIRVSF